MFTLLVLVVFGLMGAYFATQNTGLVHIVIANYLIGGVPLYIIVIGSMLVGIFISWLISIASSVSSNIRIHGTSDALRTANERIESLKKENNTLVMENNRLREWQRQAAVRGEVNKGQVQDRPSFLHRVRHTFS